MFALGASLWGQPAPLRAQASRAGVRRVGVLTLPVIGPRAVWADDGALFAYGTSLDDQHRRSALVVDTVLRGARAADIPVEQATLFELVIKLKTAKALGITIPRSILLRADRVIE